MTATTLTRADLAFRVEPKPFAAACDWVAKRIPSKLINPVLGGVLIEIADGRLTVSGFDYDVSTRATIEAVGDADGQVLVSGRLLAALVKTLPNQPVNLAVENGRLVITCGRVKAGLPTMAVEDYPTLPPMPAAVGAIDAAAFADAVDRVAPAAAGPKELPHFQAVNLRAGGDTVSLWAADRYRAAIATLPWRSTGVTPAVNVLIPAGVLRDAASTLEQGGGDVTVAVGETGQLAGLSGAGRNIVARLIAGDYPNLPGLFPAVSDTPAVVQVADLVDALKRAALVRADLEPVYLTFNHDTVTVQASGETSGANTDAVVDIEYAGEPMRIGVNPDRLADRLNALRSATAEVHLTSPRKAIVLTSPGVDPETCRHLVMPVQKPGGNA